MVSEIVLSWEGKEGGMVTKILDKPFYKNKNMLCSEAW